MSSFPDAPDSDNFDVTFLEEETIATKRNASISKCIDLILLFPTLSFIELQSCNY
jgi:hypothetical protein